MCEMTVSLRNDITVTMKDTINIIKGEQQINLTPKSQPELTQYPPRVEELKNLIDEMDIVKKIQQEESTNTVRIKSEPSKLSSNRQNY